jgi:branched-chain amino acid transport system ATP-binding protein
MFGSPYASAPIAAIKNHAEVLGIEVGPDQDVSLFAIDTKSQIMALKSFGADVIWHGNTTMSVSTTIRDAYALGLRAAHIINNWGFDENLPRLAGDAMNAPDAVTVMGAAPNGFYGQDCDLMDKVVEYTKKVHPGVPQEKRICRTVQGWSNGIILWEAMKRADKAGDLTGPGIREKGFETMRDFHIGLCTGDVSYSADDHRPAGGCWVQEWKDGKFQKVAFVDVKARWSKQWADEWFDGKKGGFRLETAQTILSVNNIEVKYHEVILVLKGVSLEVPSGGIVALLGANGAGKSTTLKSISGLLKVEVGKVTDGAIEFEGVMIHKKPAVEIAKMGIIQVIEGRRVFEHLTVEENLKVGAHLRKTGSVKDGLELVYHYFPRLREKRSETAGFISGGEQQMAVVGRALMTEPKLVLLDEPSMGLAPMLIHEIFNILMRLNKEEKISILLVEQNVKLALNVAPYAYVMETGRIVMDDTSEKLKENEDIKDFYLGLSEKGKTKSFAEVKHYKRRKRWLT